MENTILAGSLEPASHTVNLDSILKLNDVIHITKLSKPSIYKLAALDKFPRPYKIGLRSSGFKASEVYAWLANLEPSNRLIVEV